MPPSKTIQINPDFLQSSRKRLKKKSSRKKNKEHSLKANDIKKQLLQKIKEQQKKSQEAFSKEITKKQSGGNKLDTDFKTSIDYLNILSKEKREKKKVKKEKKEKKKRQKKQAQTQPIKKYEVKPDPPYGCLKGGKKPLYREYIKTLKKKIPTEDNTIKIHDKNEKSTDPNILKRQHKLKKIQKRVKKRKYTLGKDKKRRIIGVLVKNKTMKKKIQNDIQILKKTSIHDIKKYLRKHGLIKMGSAAPNDIVHQMYEDANLAGNIYNRSPEILLHNYLNDEK